MSVVNTQDLLVYTVGHSTRPWEAFASLLRSYEVKLLVDVRRWPTSKRHPQFEREEMSDALSSGGVEYLWIEELGGYRSKTQGESPNEGWESEGFQNYADHLLTDEGQEALDLLEERAGTSRVAVMCAERLFWRCHRRIVADHLVARGLNVVHILDEGETQEHELTSFAEVEDGHVAYPPTTSPELHQ